MQESHSPGLSIFKIKAGYKYLIMDFFYGPQLDFYFGYADYGYSLDTQTSDGFTEFSFGGILFGLRGSIPLKNILTIYTGLDILPSGGYSEQATIFGDSSSVSNYDINIGATYLHSPKITIDGQLNILNSKASFSTPSREISLKNTSFRLGAVFNF